MVMKKKISAPKTLVMDTPNTRNNQVLDTKTTPTKEVVISDVSHRTHSGDSLKGLFYIIKGQYRKTGASFLNTATDSVSYIGGYDPESDETSDWYMVRDYETHHCIACGRDLEKMLECIRVVIKRYKGSAKKYFKYVSDTTSDDLYEVRYLGHSPLTHDQRNKKCVGRCPRVSPADRCLYDCVYQEYGMYFRDLIEEVEDQAYEELREERPLNKTKKRLARGGKHLKMTLESKTPPINEVLTLKRPVVKTIKKLAVV